MQHDGTLENFPFRGPLTYMQRHPENNYSRTITNMDHIQMTSMKKYINLKTQALLMLQYIELF